MSVRKSLGLENLYPILNQDGFVGLITGKRDKGKTDISLLLAEICYLSNFRKKIATNIKTESYMIERQITNIPDYKDWLEEKGRKLFILDELGKHGRKLGFMSKKNQAIMEAIQLTRHYDCGFIGASPNIFRFIDSGFLDEDIVDFIIKKYSREVGMCKTYEGTNILLWNIPKTSITFNSKDIAEFTLEKKYVLSDLPLCCKVASLYSQFGSYKQIRQALKLDDKQIQREIMKHCQHSLLSTDDLRGGRANQQTEPKP